MQKVKLFTRYTYDCCSRAGTAMNFSSTSAFAEKSCYKLVIVGGGTGGATMAAKLCSKVGEKNLAIIEPSDVHYYQPYWTLVGAGIFNFRKSHRPMASVLPKNVHWIKDEVISFNPGENSIETKSGHEIKYEFLILASGLTLAFEKIKGLPEAFGTPGVCSNYSSHTVEKTAVAIQSFEKGNAIFTQPPNPIKCAGAPQKIMYLAEDSFRKSGKRQKANILFYTALGTLFSAPIYDVALRKVVDQKGICVNYEHNLIEVKPDLKEAVFENKSAGSCTVTVKYEMLHVTPPMIAPLSIRNSEFADQSGFVDVDKCTLQQKKYPNVFAIGDCTNIPTSKTAAAIAAQSIVLLRNLVSAMENKPLKAIYDGYTSCPLVTGNNKGILAEFDFSLRPLETLPIDQSKERYLFYMLKKDVIPFIYWNMMLKGWWNGPAICRKILHLGLTK